MGICWYCHWGWAKPVAEIYKQAVEKLGGDSHALHFGPAHIVWEDENFDWAEECLERFDSFGATSDFTAEELSIVRWSLEELAKTPLETRCPEPEDYDGNNPELFPPTGEVVFTNA